VSNRKGATSKGSFNFWSRSIQVWTGNKTVDVEEAHDGPELFGEMVVGVQRQFRIGKVRMNGTVPVFGLL